IRLVASHAPASMLARKLAALVIERVTVAEPGGIAKYRDPSIIFDPSHLNVIRDITPHQIPADTVPRGSFRPQGAEMKTANDRIAHDVSAESIIQRDNIRIRILNRILPGIIARCWRR